MNAQIPFPSFEDIRKVLQFWIDQQDKWFYFEGPTLQSDSHGERDVPNPLHMRSMSEVSRSHEVVHYLQTRVVGRIKDIISFPPSLLLEEAHVFTARLSYDQGFRSRIVSDELRHRYGLVFSQITYWEPLGDHEAFLQADPRVATKARS